VIVCIHDRITTAQLPFDRPPDQFPSSLNLSDIERFYIELALKRTAGNKTRAAHLLGISRKTLTEKVRKYRMSSLGDDDA
jgi:DNA-binding NtrC family response regulator